MTRGRSNYGPADRERSWAAAWAAEQATDPVPTVVIGQELIHTTADRARAVAQLSTGFRALAGDIAVWMAANRDHPNAVSNAQWIAAEVTPTLEEWGDFTKHQRSWWAKTATSWDTFEHWSDRLTRLRSMARAHGFVLQSAEPVSLPKTIWQLSAQGKGSEATAVLGVLKVGALTTLGIMGIAGLCAAIRNVRARADASADRETLRLLIRDELSRSRSR